MESGNSSAVKRSFCKFCGSPHITQTKYSSMNSYGGIGKKLMGIQAQFGGLGAGVNFNTNSKETVYRPTWYCETCKKIDCLDSINPLEVLVKGDEFSYKFVIPSALQNLLRYLDVSETTLRELLDNLSKSLKKPIRSFLKSGISPCKSGNIGTKRKILISSENITIWILMENYQGQLLARIIYDGGYSQC